MQLGSPDEFFTLARTQRHEALGEDWVVALTTDHGHKPGGGHGEDEVEVRRSFLVVHRFGGPLPGWLHAHPTLRSHQVCPLLLRLLGVQEASWPNAHAVGRLVDIPGDGPTRDLDFEW